MKDERLLGIGKGTARLLVVLSIPDKIVANPLGASRPFRGIGPTSPFDDVAPLLTHLGIMGHLLEP